jgi:hypothetical protein
VTSRAPVIAPSGLDVRRRSMQSRAVSKVSTLLASLLPRTPCIVGGKRRPNVRVVWA